MVKSSASTNTIEPLRHTLRSLPPLPALPAKCLPAAENFREPDDHKIIVVSAGRAGNTWLKWLLSHIYGLPDVHLPAAVPESGVIDYKSFTPPERRWISQQHFLPQRELLRWAEDEGVRFVTVLRHPADILVSLYCYVCNHYEQYHDSDTIRLFDPEAKEAARSGKPITDNSPLPAAPLLRYIHERFFHDLNISIMWLRLNLSLPIHYEELWLEPVAALRRITDKLLPVPLGFIEQAVLECRFSALRERALATQNSHFFRIGGIGGWRRALPAEVVKVLREHPLYSRQFAWMGYDLDPDNALYHREQTEVQGEDFPFLNHACFDNGLRIAPTIARLYLSTHPSARDVWNPVQDTGRPGAFYQWLNAPAEADPHRGEVDRRLLPTITNFAAYVYSRRQDLRMTFPDIFGANRIEFANWFVRCVQNEYPRLEPDFVHPVLMSWVENAMPLTGIQDLASHGLRSRA